MCRFAKGIALLVSNYKKLGAAGSTMCEITFTFLSFLRRFKS